VLLCQDERIWLEDLPSDLHDHSDDAGTAAHVPIPETHEQLKRAKKETKMQLERMFVLRALQKAGGNISEAARQTGMNRVQLQKLIAALMIDTDQVKAASRAKTPIS